MPQPEPIVYAGLGWAPNCPLSDMHGLIRVAVLARNRHAAIQFARKAGIRKTMFWHRSASFAEQQAAKAAGVGVPVGCPLQVMYLAPGYYRKL